MISVSALNVRGIDPSDAAVLNLLSDSRRQKVHALVLEKDKRLSIGAELAYLALKKELGIDAVYGYAPDGKPFMTNNAFHIAFAHSVNIAVCALSAEPVGIDVEMIRRVSAAVPRAVLTGEEYETYSAVDKSARVLIETWSAKESYLKLTGEGVTQKKMLSVRKKDSEITDLHGNALAHIFTRTIEEGAHTYCLCVASITPPEVIFRFTAAEQVLKTLMK